jgi:hypothetical protein
MNNVTSSKMITDKINVKCNVSSSNQYLPEIFFSLVHEHKSKNVRIKTIIYVVLHKCEIWSPTLMEEHTRRVFRGRVLRRSFGLNRDEMTGGWRKLHNKEPRSYSSHNIIGVMR